jgi:hypothetical protein
MTRYHRYWYSPWNWAWFHFKWITLCFLTAFLAVPWYIRAWIKRRRPYAITTDSL